MSDKSPEEENDEKETISEYSGFVNFPKYSCEPDKQNLEWGIKEASYITGFVGTINKIGLSENILASIILNKINLEYQKEMLRMELESQERIASVYSNTPVNIYNGNDEDGDI
jgi:hypothetical protein